MTELFEPEEGGLITAEQQSEIVRLARRRFSGPGVIQNSEGLFFPGARVSKGGGQTAQFKLTEIADSFPDHLICRMWNGTTLGNTDVLVAKPWDLRQTSFDGRGDSVVDWYGYVTPTRRDAFISGGDLVERQIIIRRYEIGNVIHATKDIKGGTGVIHEGSPVVWLDDNNAGRAFAAMFAGG